MTKRFGYLFTLGFPLAAASLALAWMLGMGSAAEGSYVYETVPVSTGTIRKIVATSGPVRARVTVSVGSQLSGQIETVNVDFNSGVKPGDLVATIDAQTFKARVEQGKADLAVAEAALVNQEAALTKATSVRRLAERTLERQKSLAAKGFASTAALDQAMRDVEVAKADIAVAEAQIASAKATIAQRSAQLNQAKIDLERTDIRAPIEGTVISRTVDPGQTVAASLQAPELFKIAQDLSLIRIEAQVNEADVGLVSEGNLAVFTVDAYPDRQFTGRVTQVRLAATEINNVVTYAVIIEAQNGDRRLFPGMTANVEIETSRKDDALRVSNDALRFKPKAAVRAPARTGRQAGRDRSARTIEHLKSELQLSASQEGALKRGLADLQRDMRSGFPNRIGSVRPNPTYVRQRITSMIDRVLGPLLTDEQRSGFEKWKKGRNTVRHASLWVLAESGLPEQRGVRLGLSDDQFTEILGGDLKEGDAVIIRAREVTE